MLGRGFNMPTNQNPAVHGGSIKDQNKTQGCLLGLAIGDSLGSLVEFIHSREDILAITNGKGITDIPNNGYYTDDTQMTICVAEALLEGAGDADKFIESLCKKYVEWHDLQYSDPNQRRAPGNTCLIGCNHLKQGVHWEESGVPASTGCGSAMRSAPIGLFFERVEKIVDYAINSSKPTHPNELAECAAVGSSFVTYLALHGEPPGVWANELLKVVSINKEFKHIINLAAETAAMRLDPWHALSTECIGEGWTGHEAVASALYCCMMNPNSYKDAVLMAANTVGDSDSIACIVGAWMGARLGTDGIPNRWIDLIENKTKLIELGDQLFAAKIAT